MRRLILIIPVMVIAGSGCTLVPCNHVSPKPAFIFSREAIECRKEQRLERQATETNKPNGIH